MTRAGLWPERHLFPGPSVTSGVLELGLPAALGPLSCWPGDAAGPGPAGPRGGLGVAPLWDQEAGGCDADGGAVFQWHEGRETWCWWVHALRVPRRAVGGSHLLLRLRGL